MDNFIQISNNDLPNEGDAVLAINPQNCKSFSGFVVVETVKLFGVLNKTYLIESVIFQGMRMVWFYVGENNQITMSEHNLTHFVNIPGNMARYLAAMENIGWVKV